jgi:hypothetical protein
VAPLETPVLVKWPFSARSQNHKTDGIRAPATRRFSIGFPVGFADWLAPAFHNL